MARLDADDALEFLSELVLDTDEPWGVEPFQESIIRDIASGTRKVWVVIPEGNAKTTLMAGISLAFARQNKLAKIPVCAASRDQAGLLYGQAMEMLIRSGKGSSGSKFGTDEFRISEGHRRIEHRKQGSRIEVKAADERTGDGGIFDIAFVDELHRHRTLGLYRTWAGKLQKRDGQIVVISTAGAPGSEFEQTRARMRDGSVSVDGKHTRVEGEDFILHEWALDPEDAVDDFGLVKLANPLSTITAESLAAKYASPEMTHAHWSRLTCNIPTSDEGSWLPPGQWESLAVPGASIPEGSVVYVGLDIGLVNDATAMVLLSEQDGRWLAEARIYEPPKNGELELSFIESEIRSVCDRYEVLEVAYDPWQFKRSGELLLDEGLPMVLVPMTNERMVPASQDLHEAVKSGTIFHNGDEKFAQHVVAGVMAETSRGWRIDKKRTKQSIDALIALLLAYSRTKAMDTSPVLEWVA